MEEFTQLKFFKFLIWFIAKYRAGSSLNSHPPKLFLFCHQTFRILINFWQIWWHFSPCLKLSNCICRQRLAGQAFTYRDSLRKLTFKSPCLKSWRLTWKLRVGDVKSQNTFWDVESRNTNWAFQGNLFRLEKFSWETNWRCQFISSTSVLSEMKSPWKSYFMSFSRSKVSFSYHNPVKKGSNRLEFLMHVINQKCKFEWIYFQGF